MPILLLLKERMDLPPWLKVVQAPMRDIWEGWSLAIAPANFKDRGDVAKSFRKLWFTVLPVRRRISKLMQFPLRHVRDKDWKDDRFWPRKVFSSINFTGAQFLGINYLGGLLLFSTVHPGIDGSSEGECKSNLGASDLPLLLSRGSPVLPHSIRHDLPHNGPVLQCTAILVLV